MSETVALIAAIGCLLSFCIGYYRGYTVRSKDVYKYSDELEKNKEGE